LWTVDQLGKPVEIINIDNDELEASFICNKISEFQNEGIKLSNIAILTRASFQFKDLEDRFIKESIKYRVVGGLRFYERKEIKDAIAYFRLLVNKSDNLSLERIINVPKRSIGPSTIKKLYQISKGKGITLYDSIKFGVSEKIFTNKIEKNLNQFLSIIEKYTMMLETTDHSDVAGSLLDDSGYTEMLQKEKSPESEGRLENLKKLVIDIRNRDSLGDFLEEVSLLTDIMDNNLNFEKVSLMTLHSAKGLEFDYVFLPGWEEGIFPNQRNIDEYGTKGLEEERRLGYVGITRARKNLIISYVNFRKQYNYSFYRSLPSRFISELPKKNCKLVISNEKKIEKQKLLNYSSINFSIGDKIFHSEFGEGQVLGINDNKLQIRFNKSSEIIKIFSDFVKKI
jgi:DNA helicase-2/ATP-dependent DNA helicase PcrA